MFNRIQSRLYIADGLAAILAPIAHRLQFPGSGTTRTRRFVLRPLQIPVNLGAPQLHRA